MAKIAVLLSGGVDSSVALALLKSEGGHALVAFYLKIWLEDELAFLGECPWEDDLAQCRAVCEQLDVELRVIPLQREYHERVVAYALHELRAGRTPSPDIMCNQEVKFGAFLAAVDESFDKVASGHYARVEEQPPGHFQLLRAPDPVKDQSYFLSSLNQRQLARIIFPIGHLRKSRVRELAHELALPNRARKDSQGICFLGKIPYNDFVRHHLGEREGPILDLHSGKKLGVHKGVWFHTIGQRTGLGLSGGPWFVVSKDMASNILQVVHADRHEEAVFKGLTSREIHWIDAVPGNGARLQVKLRHGPNLSWATLQHRPDGLLHITLDQSDKGIAPGQSVIFYDGERCLGRAVIDQGLLADPPPQPG